MTARSAPARPKALRLTPAQERTLRELAEAGTRGVAVFHRGGNPHSANILCLRSYAEGHWMDGMFGWRITAAGRAWLAAREGVDA